VLATVLAATAAATDAGAAKRENVGLGTLSATIGRDAYGVPHVRGRTQRGMWFGAGWAQAEDRLVQMELVRRNVRGKLAELFGPSELSDDQDNRRDFYTDAELRSELRSLPRGIRRSLRDYAAGINAYVAAIYGTPASRDASVPNEFWLIGRIVGLGDQPYRPPRWSPVDTVAIGNFLAREFGGGGGSELDYETFRRYLEAKLRAQGHTAPALNAGRIFNDALWINDPTAPTTVPGRGSSSFATGRTAGAAGAGPVAALPDSSLTAAAAAQQRTRAGRQRRGETFGVPWKDGSNSWVVSPRRSKSGRALLWGGPQEGFSSPSIDVEAYLKAPGYAAGGMAISGEPYVLIGQNREIAFTTTSEELVNQQVYVEQDVDYSSDPPTYRYKGRRLKMQKIVERIPVAGQPASLFTIYRTVHGPVFRTDPANRVAYTNRFASWKREQGSLAGFAAQSAASNLREYTAAVRKVATLHNFFYADRAGNIAYFGAGRVPILPRCAACDPRLPHLGDGSQEWRGYVPWSRMPRSINPRQGYLVNWNTKPSATQYYQQNGGDEYWGTIYRSQRIAQLIRAKPKLRLGDMLAIERDVGTMDGDRTYRPAAPYFLPVLLAAYDRLRTAGDPVADPVSHPLLDDAIGELRRWDRYRSLGSPALSIFVQWMGALRRNVFGGGALPGEPYVGPINLSDESLGFGNQLGRATYNLLWHILGGTRGLNPCNRLCYRGDYFGGKRDQVLVQSLNDAVTRLSGTEEQWDNQGAPGFGTTNIRGWRWKPVADIDWDELNPVADLVVRTSFGKSPSQERSTYMQALELRKRIRGVNMLPPGQSGFLSKAGTPNPHFGDQISLFNRFRYKPMRLR
jgi:penicillin amidase